MDLGNLPLSLEFLSDEYCDFETFETIMMVCRDCGLGQLTVDAGRERMFSDYTYKTSVSNSFVKHAEKYVDDIVSNDLINNNGWVLEIASNDGYMLDFFMQKGIDCLGVEPAVNLAQISLEKGIPTINEFFGTELAKKILEEKGNPSLIVANNVMAHVPDIQDFMQGIAILCGDKTVVSIENPTIMNILLKNHFDTIFHEHYSYLSATSVSKLAEKFGLELFSVQEIPTQGGSNRYWIMKNPPFTMDIPQRIRFEWSNGLFDEAKWQSVMNRIKNKMADFKDKIYYILHDQSVVCGYAASSKATVQINFAKIGGDAIECIADDGEEKLGKFVPAMDRNIPIVSMSEMLSRNPDHIIIFPWNIQTELTEKLRALVPQHVRIWSWLD